MKNRRLKNILALFLAIGTPVVSLADDPIRVDTSGKVGISNNTPTEALHVKGKLKVETSGLGATLAGNDLKFNRTGGDSYVVQSASDGGLRFQIGTADALLLRNNQADIGKPFRLSDSQYENCANGLDTSNHNVICDSSSGRYKERITDYHDGLNKLTQLRPVSFEWRDKALRGARREVGLIAEEVAQVAPELIFYSNGQVEGVVYDSLTVMLLNAVQHLNDTIQQLNDRIEVLESEALTR